MQVFSEKKLSCVYGLLRVLVIELVSQENHGDQVKLERCRAGYRNPVGTEVSMIKR